MNKKVNKEILDAMRRNPHNWRGVFYVNRKDPRLIVPKMNPSMGWTLNFGSPLAYVFIILVVLIAIGTTFLSN
jgi:uncharacterized membrane protein